MLITGETKHQPQGADVFPLAPDSIANATVASEGFTEKELALVYGTNLAILPENNPMSYLLRLEGRPEIPFRGETAEKAYRAGVCLASSIVLERLRILDEESGGQIKAPAIVYDPQDPPNLKPLQVKKEVIKAEEIGEQTGIYNRYTPSRDLFPFLESVSSIEDLEHLKYSWMMGDHDFLGDEARKRWVDDFLFTGILDAFTVYADIYGYDYSAVEKPRSNRTLLALAAAKLLVGAKRRAQRIAGLLRDESIEFPEKN